MQSKICVHSPWKAEEESSFLPPPLPHSLSSVSSLTLMKSNVQKKKKRRRRTKIEQHKSSVAPALRLAYIFVSSWDSVMPCWLSCHNAEPSNTWWLRIRFRRKGEGEREDFQSLLRLRTAHFSRRRRPWRLSLELSSAPFLLAGNIHSYPWKQILEHCGPKEN